MSGMNWQIFIINILKRSKKNTRILLWASATGVAATVVIILVLRAMMISSQPEIIQVFQANHVAQEVTLQVNDEKEIKPLKEVVESLSSSSTAQLSSKEIDYSRALLQTETKEVGKQKVQIHRLSIPRERHSKSFYLMGLKFS